MADPKGFLSIDRELPGKRDAKVRIEDYQELYVEFSEEKTIKVLSENGDLLNEITFDADKGFNYTSYDLTLTEKGRKALLKSNTRIEISKAKNGAYYLPKGTYTIQIGDEKSNFTLK